MIYHLYDNNRQHLAMSDSLEDLQNAARQAFQQDGLPYAYVRWADVTGQHQEVRITSASLAATNRPATLGTRRVHAAQSGRPRGQRSARQRANLITGVAIVFLLLFLTSEIAAIILQKPLSAAVFGY
ncbi:hypothetical protein [Pelagibius sp.]|uniref:hypothetical protein n=1 Tax=Pelagibius sp. TaxID=1931238 RepID=UPI003B514DEA